MNTENTFRFIGMALVLASFFIAAYHRRQADQSGEEISTKGEGAPILVLRSIFGMLLWLAQLAYFLNPKWMAWSQAPLLNWMRWLGVVIMALCVPLFYWLFSSLGKNVTKTVVTRAEHQLVTHGPYRWVRHPLYAVGFLFYFGLILLTANWFILLTTLVTFGILFARTSIEEAKLIERFGDEYREYMRTTGRYWPRMRKK